MSLVHMIKFLFKKFVSTALCSRPLMAELLAEKQFVFISLETDVTRISPESRNVNLGQSI